MTIRLSVLVGKGEEAQISISSVQWAPRSAQTIRNAFSAPPFSFTLLTCKFRLETIYPFLRHSRLHRRIRAAFFFFGL